MASPARFAWLPWGDQPGGRFVGNGIEQSTSRELGEGGGAVAVFTPALGGRVRGCRLVELGEFDAD